MVNEYSKIEGNGLLQDYYSQEDRLTDALRNRRQKLAEKKIGLAPDGIDTDYNQPERPNEE